MDNEVDRLGQRAIDLWNVTLAWIEDHIFDVANLYQFAAAGIALFGAILFHRMFARIMKMLAEKFNSVRFLGRVLRTLSAISLPIVWVLGLWIGNAVLQWFGQPNELMRLLGSLLNAWIIIRIASIFLPTRYSSVFSWCVWSVAALNSVGLLTPAIEALDARSLMVGDVRLSAWVVVKAIIVTLCMVVLAVIISGLVQRQLENTRSLNASMRILIGKIVRLVMVMIAIVIGMTAVGIDLTAFAIFSGAIGVGVGLGMQKTVANLFAGLSLLAGRSIKPGDVIELETTSGPTYGIVRSMTSRHVSVETRDGTETLIPNEILISNPVTNWSYSSNRVRRRIPVGVAYSTDVEHAMALCLQAADEVSRVLKTPKPACLIRGFGDSSVDLELRVWLDDPQEGLANVTSLVYLRIWTLFRENDIEIPFPQRDLHIRSTVGAMPVLEGS